ncbi:RNA polymerase sigma factor [Paenibacillus sp. GD4]|uniref:RNA polymerase sigma factor n=1 Tax=Paenibacillus sp. GD4 TaxID=3068890 RepID=UPI002796BACF|nr:RNA polymerase sigma factor [Paenibacillus sp. GD4]MDQ1912908.1 RNA polymerase sigma factor [Paenibacillus sp. GD4]
MRDEREQDSELTRRVLAGDKQAYAFLVNKYKNKIYNVIRGMGVSLQDAQDLTQETFLRAYRKLAARQEERSFAAWIYSIATNLVKDEWKKRRMELTELDSQLPSGEKGPEEALLLEERKRELLVYLEQLPRGYREALLLRYTGDLSYEEIGELLGIPTSKVQNDLYRAKQRLKQVMTEKEVAVNELLDTR